MHTLNPARLSLRMFRESDLDAYAEMCADPDVMRFLGDGHILTRPEAWRNMATVLGHWQLRGFGLWAVEERADRASGRPGRLLAARGLARPRNRLGSPSPASGAEAMPPRLLWRLLNYAFNRLKQHASSASFIPITVRQSRSPSASDMRMEGYTQVMDHSVLIYGIDSVSRLPDLKHSPAQPLAPGVAHCADFEKYENFTKFDLPAPIIVLDYTVPRLETE